MDRYCSVVTYGDLVLDLVFYIEDAELKLGDISILVNKAIASPGGATANTSVALSRLGVTVCLLASIGSDAIGELLMKDLEKEKVVTSYVKRIRGRSGLVVPLVLPGGRRTLLSYRGVCAENIVEINEIDDVLENAELVYGSGYVFNNVDNGSSLVEIFSRAQDYDVQTFLELGGIEKTSARNLFALRNLLIIFR